MPWFLTRASRRQPPACGCACANFLLHTSLLCTSECAESAKAARCAGKKRASLWGEARDLGPVRASLRKYRVSLECVRHERERRPSGG